jgi:hypothetical protein
VISLVTILGSTFLLKGKNKQYGIAVGVGALVPAVSTYTSEMMTAENPRHRVRGPSMRRARVRRIGTTNRTKGRGAASYTVSSRNLDNLA